MLELMNNLHTRSIHELHNSLLKQEITTTDLVNHFLQQIERHNSDLNIFLKVFEQRALQQAAKLQKELDEGFCRGHLHGIPIAIKDIFDFQSHTASGGSKALRSNSRSVATVVEKLVASGANILGVLNMDEYAAGGTGDNIHFGRCKNPWDKHHITGGSSGGSAAAIAASMCCGTIGSDAGGSIRIPAAFCGVVGLKPTYGRVSRNGAVPRTWSMDCIGPFGHTIDDVAYLFESINGVDNKDNTSVAIPAYNHHIENRNSCHENKPAQNIRIGVLKNAQRYQQSLLAYDSAINLMSAAGVEIVEIQLPLLERYTELHQRIVKSEAVALHKKALLDENSILSHAVRSVIRDGLKISAADYLEALCLRGPLLDDFVTTAFKQVDILALPVSLDHAPLYQPAEELTERQVDADFARSAIFTRFANYLGIPGLTVPSGLFETSTSNNEIPNNNLLSKALPGAVQFVAAPFQEEALFDIGRWFEYMRGDIARPSIN